MRQLKFTELCAIFGPYINLAGALNVNQGELVCRQLFAEMCKPPAKPFDPAMYESDPEGMELMSRSGEVVRWVAKPINEHGRGVYTLVASNKMRMFNWENGQLDRGEEGPHDLMMRIIDKPVAIKSGIQAEVEAAAPVVPVPPEGMVGDLRVVLDVANPRTRAARFNAQAAQQAVVRAHAAVAGGEVRRGILVDPPRPDGVFVNHEAAADAIREARGEVAARYVEVPPAEVAPAENPLNNNF